MSGALLRRRVRRTAMPPGTFAIDVWPYASGSGDAYIPLTLPAGRWPSGSAFTVTMAGIDRAAGLQVTSTHGDGSLRTGTIRAAVTGTTKDVIQTGTITLGTAGPSQSYVQPTWPTSAPSGSTLVKDVVPFHAIGMMTDAATLCASNVFGALVPAASNPAISGITAYEALLDGGLTNYMEGQRVDSITTPTNTYQYDRPALAFRAAVRKGSVRWMARGWQVYAVIRALGLSITGPGPFGWSEPYMGWETQNEYAQLLLGDSIARDFEIVRLTNQNATFDGILVNGTDTLAGARYVAHLFSRFITLANAGVTTVIGGRTPAQWSDYAAVRLLASTAWTTPAAGQRAYFPQTPPASINFWNTFLMYAMACAVDRGTLGTTDRANVVTRLREWLEWTWVTQWQAAPPNGSGVPRFPDYLDSDPNVGEFNADLNGLHAHVFAWMFRETGNTLWRDRADAIIATWTANDAARGFLNVVGGNQDNQSRGKVFQESYTWSQLTFGYRAGV